MEKLGLNLGFLLVHIINFAIVYVVLRAWVFGPVTKMLEDRRNKIAQGLEDARIAADARATAEKAADKIIGDAQLKANEIIRETTSRAEALQKEMVAEAKQGIDKQRENALSEVEEERVRLLSEMRGDVSAIAIAAAQKLIGEALDEKRQRTLLAEFFSGVKNGRVVVIEDQSVSGSGAEVTSALPLTSEEQQTVKQDVLSKIGNTASISFRVDPAILGGLVVKIGDRVVDGSVAGQLSNLQRSLQ
ncbi:MAG: ATP synthase F0 subunit B [Chloroflexi bacterium HGW-Chloroflexi-2]|nr:MAG: ATP synthase F0 subunit B [Chloroflexi bacterium HGW-Chloroflexi-2]